MAIQRRTNRAFAIMIVLFFVVGYAMLTGAAAGSEGPCSSSNGNGHIAWVWEPFPRYDCVIGYR